MILRNRVPPIWESSCGAGASTASACPDVPYGDGMASKVDELLRRARAGIRRYEPRDVPRDATIIDIRCDGARDRHGVIPGALHIPRTVLEWRLDRTSEWRSPRLRGDERLVLVCDHGYSSSLAAAGLAELGVEAADVVGGFEAWAHAGCPVVPAGARWEGLPGTAPPDGADDA